jgi:hypothetical protein
LPELESVHPVKTPYNDKARMMIFTFFIYLAFN